MAFQFNNTDQETLVAGSEPVGRVVRHAAAKGAGLPEKEGLISVDEGRPDYAAIDGSSSKWRYAPVISPESVDVGIS